MKKLGKELELSPQIKQGHYANFSRATQNDTDIFMAGYEECAPDYRIKRAEFPFWIMEFIVGGIGYFKNNEAMQVLGHGSVFCYGPGMGFEFWNQSDRPFKKYFLVAGSDRCPAAWLEAGLRLGKVRQMQAVAPVITIFDQILKEGELRDGQTHSVMRSLHPLLLALIERHQGVNEKEATGSRKAYELTMAALQQDYRKLNSLADLAERSGYSGEYLCRIFRKYHGETPYRVLTQRKMTAAWLLLRDRRLQVGSVAREIGFEDPLHFSRVFRRVMGCAPSLVGQG
ncbi:MAG: HTH-type transcriptional activator Btr [Opitutia bacterium UBA7350]|nr:MAG: HTH-type transcriptional activator Btr [Opitutae bacterium UBA7350]